MIAAFYRSTVGKKIIMAITGIIWVLFVIAHVAGNLQAFFGPDKLNAYSALLHGPGAELLWLMRIVLIVAFVLHVLMAYQLWLRGNAARPDGYRDRDPQVSTWASRQMRLGGTAFLLFLAYHILHFTTRNVDPAGYATRTDAAGRYDIYGNLVSSFQIWWVSASYLVAMILLGLHLWPGIWASPRSLGVARPSDDPMRRKLASILAIALWLGFSLVPLAVMAGVIR